MTAILLHLKEKLTAMNSELISIIVPVYNAGRFIVETMQSVKSQTYDNWEMLLIDNGSTDDSEAKIKNFITYSGNDTRIRYISTELRGAAYARNIGIEEASGDYICFLDADDLWEPCKLERQLSFMKEKDCEFSFTGYEFADEAGIGVEKIVHVPATINYKRAVRNTTIFTSTVMFDMRKLSKELITMPIVPSEDTATWWKILRTGLVAYGLDEAFTLYRRSGNTLSSNKLEALYRIWNLYRNVEHFGVVRSCFNFVGYAYHAVMRRI